MHNGSKVTAAIVLAFVSTVAAERSSFAQGFTPYTNPMGGFTIMYPGNWEQRMVGTTLVALSPQEGPADTFRENVNVVFEPLTFPMAPQQYAMASLSSMQTQLAGFALVEQGPAMVGGRPAHRMVYNHFMGQPLSVLAYFLVVNGRGYVITCSGSPGQLARYRPYFDQIANTIRFP
jgi:hypothetical protein